jgi:hypothetical protein
MLRDVSTTPPVRQPSRLSPASAPPGASFAAAPPADAVSLSAGSAEAGDRPARVSRARLLVLSAAAVVAAAGVVSLVHSPASSQPAPPSQSVSTSTENAPVRLAVVDPAPARQETARLVSARLGVVPQSRPFNTSDLSLVPSEGVETRVHQGQTLNLRWQHTSLRDARVGEMFPASDLTAYLEDFNNEATADWEVHATMQPAGNTERLASVIVREGGYTGGMHANEQVTLRTIDRESMQLVSLPSLLEPEVYQKISQTVRQRLSAEDALHYQHDAATLQEHIDYSFAVNQENGRTTITIAVPNSIQVANGSVAEFVFELPRETVLTPR